MFVHKEAGQKSLQEIKTVMHQQVQFVQWKWLQAIWPKQKCLSINLLKPFNSDCELPSLNNDKIGGHITLHKTYWQYYFLIICKMLLFSVCVTGIPGLFTIIWALCAHFYHDEQMCWRNFTSTPFFAIIMAPICIAVTVSGPDVVWRKVRATKIMPNMQ